MFSSTIATIRSGYVQCSYQSMIRNIKHNSNTGANQHQDRKSHKKTEKDMAFSFLLCYTWY